MSNLTTESDISGNLPFSEPPDRLAWKLCRCLCRLVGSVFFSYFRVWGETELHNGGRIFVGRDYGVQTWVTALRVFRQPLRLVYVGALNDRRWFELACKNGLAPLILTGSVDEKFLAVKKLAMAGENLLLVLPQPPDASLEDLVGRLRATRLLQVLFLAISGASAALPPGAFIPRAVPISVFCGLTPYQNRPGDSPLTELEILERAIHGLEIDELPSIFFNHRRNLSRIHSC
ncbi:MAG TPA: hypothetical protein PLM07_13595 [Candidatus Rifleibacterium sp.]|nr:hypothetical protein [Candidatus Rifleibacterium sp.]HPT46919.1 hypothetical protein [Candidatus Rifleibacterium sp.]